MKKTEIVGAPALSLRTKWMSSSGGRSVVTVPGFRLVLDVSRRPSGPVT